MVIDFHLHYLKTRKKGAYTTSHQGQNFPLPYSGEKEFLLQALEHMDKAGVDKSVLLAGPPRVLWGCEPASNQDVLQAVGKYPDRFIGCMYIDPRDREAVETIKTYYHEGFKCIKMFPPVGFYPDDPKWSSVFEYINELKLPILCHTGLTISGSAFALPIYLDTPAALYSDVSFVLAHMGMPFYEQAWAVAYHKPNVYLEIDAAGPYLEGISKVYNGLGRYIPIDFNRVVWGTDNLLAPKESISLCLQVLKEMDFPTKSTTAIFGATARRVLQI